MWWRIWVLIFIVFICILPYCSINFFPPPSSQTCSTYFSILLKWDTVDFFLKFITFLWLSKKKCEEMKLFSCRFSTKTTSIIFLSYTLWKQIFSLKYCAFACRQLLVRAFNEVLLLTLFKMGICGPPSGSRSEWIIF